MEYRKFPGSGLKVSRLALGTMMFGGQTSEADGIAMTHAALDAGINFVDTANVYNQGASEICVGKALKGRRDKVILATKVNGRTGEDINEAGLSRWNIIRACEASLKRLDTDYIDLYYLHAPDYGTPIEETLAAMDTLMRHGKIRYYGFSNYASWQACEILWKAEKLGIPRPIASQNVYNLITRGLDDEFIPFAKHHDIGIVVYNPIAAGLLAGKHVYGDRPTEGTRFALSANYAARYWNERNFEALDKLIGIAGGAGLSILELAYRFVAAEDSVTSILSGVSKMEQLQQNLAVLDGPALTQDVLDACDAVYRELTGSRFKYNR